MFGQACRRFICPGAPSIWSLSWPLRLTGVSAKASAHSSVYLTGCEWQLVCKANREILLGLVAELFIQNSTLKSCGCALSASVPEQCTQDNRPDRGSKSHYKACSNIPSWVFVLPYLVPQRADMKTHWTWAQLTSFSSSILIHAYIAHPTLNQWFHSCFMDSSTARESAKCPSINLRGWPSSK